MARILKVLLGVLIGIYSLVGYFYLTQYSDISLNYQQGEIRHIDWVEKQIIQALASDQKIEKLDRLVDEHAVDLTIYEGEEVIFDTLKLIDKSDRSNVLNPRAVLSEFKGFIDVEDKHYEVHYIIYHLPASAYFNRFLVSGNKFLVLLVVIFFGIMLLIQYLLYRPLMNVKKTINNLERYDFDKIPEGKDEINQTLVSFANQLEGNMNLFTRRYSKFEMELEQQRVRLDNMMVVARAMVHDLKTPVHRVMLENEIKMEGASFEVQEILESNLNLLNLTMNEINQLLKVLGGVISENNQTLEMIEVESVVLEAVKRFHPYMREKELSLQLEIPPNLKIKSDLVVLRLLIHNILSNMVQYASNKTEIIFLINADDGVLEFTSMNKSNEKNIERMKNSEKLFNSFKKEESYPFSSGNGLFLIKDLTAMLNGKYQTYVEKDMVVVKVELKVSNDEV